MKIDDAFLILVEKIIKEKNGYRILRIFHMSVYFTHERIRIWMFLPVISNRNELRSAFRTLHRYRFVSYSESDDSFVIPNAVRMLQIDQLNRVEEEESVLITAMWLLKCAKPSYNSHFVSVYLHAKQYPRVFQYLGDLPGKMLMGFVYSKREAVAVNHGKEWSAFLTEILGESSWTVLHLRSRLGLALMQMGNREAAVNMLEDVYRKTCNSFGKAEVNGILSILAQVTLKVLPSNRSEAENHLRQVVFNGKNVSDCKDGSEHEKWVYYAELLTRLGFVREGLSILDDVITCRRRLFGPTDRSICHIMLFKAIIKWDNKDEEALKILQSIDRRSKKNKNVSVKTIVQTMQLKGDILGKQGKLSEALALLEQAVSLSETEFGEDHILVFQAKFQLVKILMLQKKFDKALELCFSVLDDIASVYGKAHSECFKFRRTLAEILWEKGKRLKAHRVYKDLMEDYENSSTFETELQSLRHRVQAIESGLFAAEPSTVHYGVKMGLLNKVTQTVNSENVDYFDPLRQTALHYASAFDRVEEAHVLLNNGAIFDYVSRLGSPPIHLAKEGGEMHSLLNMIHSFFKAIHDNDCDVIVDLAKKVPSVLRVSNRFGDTPLFLAIKRGHLNAVETLLRIGANPLAPGKMLQDETTPVMIAALHGHVKIIEVLLSVVGLQVLGHPDTLGRTPLLMAAEKGHLDMVRYLLSQGAVYCYKNKERQGPRQVSRNSDIKSLLRFIEDLFKDTKKGKVERVAPRLLEIREEEREAVAGAKDDLDKTLVQTAVECGHFQLAQDISIRTGIRLPKLNDQILI